MTIDEAVCAGMRLYLVTEYGYVFRRIFDHPHGGFYGPLNPDRED